MADEKELLARIASLEEELRGEKAVTAMVRNYVSSNERKAQLYDCLSIKEKEILAAREVAGNPVTLEAKAALYDQLDPTIKESLRARVEADVVIEEPSLEADSGK